jgi:general secretion pathway protein I
MRRPKSSRGFTLVEVMAAVVLVAIVLPVVMRGISLATSLGDTARRRAEAAVLAHSKLHELVVTQGWQMSTMSGDFGEDNPDYKWSAEVKDWDASTLKELDVHVTWGLGERQRSVTMTTLVETQTN